MTASATTAPRRTTWSDYPKPAPIFFGVAVTAIVGIVWFPCWFLGAQLLRLWAPRGGTEWLRGCGVEEYKADDIATAMAWVPLAPIVLRIVLAVSWLQPFVAPYDPKAASSGEWSAILGLVLGVSIGVVLTSMMRTRSWRRVAALLNLAIVTALAAAASAGVGWQPNAVEAGPLLAWAALASLVLTWVERWRNRREDRRLVEAKDAAAKGQASERSWVHLKTD